MNAMLTNYHEDILDKKGNEILAFDARIVTVDDRSHIVEMGLVDLRGETVFHSLVRPSTHVFSDTDLLGIDKLALTEAPSLSQIHDHFISAAKGKLLIGYCTNRARKILAINGYRTWLYRHVDIRDEFSRHMDEYDITAGRLRRFSLSVAALYFEGYEPRPLRDEYVDPVTTRWFPLRWDYGYGSVYRCRQVVTVARGLAAVALGRNGYRMCAGIR